MSSSSRQSSDIQQLIDQLEDPDSKKRIVAAEDLKRLAAGDLSEEQAKTAFEGLQQRARMETDHATSYRIVEAIAASKMPNSTIVDALVENLDASRSEDIRRAAVERLGKLRPDTPKAIDALKRCAVDGTVRNDLLRSEAFDVIKSIADEEDVSQWVQEKMRPPEEYGSLLVEHGSDVLDNIWGDDPQLAVQYVLGALPDWPIRHRAANWLHDKAPDIAGNPDIPPDLLKRLVREIRTAKQQERAGDSIINIWEGILVLMMGQSAIQEWAALIAEGTKTSLTLAETQSRKMRSNPVAIYYLVAEFEAARWQSSKIGEILSDAQTESTLLRKQEAEKALTESEQSTWKRWVDYLATQSGEFAEQAAKGNSEIVKWLAQVRQNQENGLRVRQKIVRQLADMSDYPRFYEGERYWAESTGNDIEHLGRSENSEAVSVWTEEIYNNTIREQLKKHVVQVFGRRLPKESDLDIRAEMARTLGNIGGRESVETLVQAVVGEERKQDRRQRLLDDYYLGPSRDRSEEAAQMLQDALVQAKRTMKVLQSLNIALFCVGLGMIIAGVLAVILGKEDPQRLAGVFALFGGVAGIIASFITDPLDRIQNAMSRLVQLEAAFTSFVWELNLNSTYIQSQYVAKGILSDDDISLTVGRMQDAMSLTLNMVQTYAVQPVQLKETRIELIWSQQTEGNTIISLYGQNLKGDSSKILVNHKPLEAQADRWTDSEVRFTLPAPVASEGADIWVSLLIDGKETNAMACKVGRSDTNSPVDASISKSGSASIASL